MLKKYFQYLKHNFITDCFNAKKDVSCFYIWPLIWHCSCWLQFSSVAQLCLTLRPHESQHARPPCPLPTPGVHSKLTSIESVIPSSHLILCRPLFLLPQIPPSITVFSNESTLRMRWPKYWSFSFSIIPSKVHPGLMSFRMDWLDLLLSAIKYFGISDEIIEVIFCLTCSLVCTC